MVTRLLDLGLLLKGGRTAFLFGPRGVGKTSLAKAYLSQNPATFHADLLRHELYTQLLTHPAMFRQQVETRLGNSGRLTVFVDEVQRLPALLDEVHGLIEDHKGKLQFLLTGSSARKLKRGGANLLGGRAWTLRLHPLTHRECKLDLHRALRFGTLPAVYLDDDAPERTLRAYVETYLREEVLQEALVRRVEGFVRFLDVAGQMNGEPLNFAALARDCGVSLKTAQEFAAILVDTLVAFRIDGWSHSVRKQLRQAPKIYFFDCGVLNAVRGELGVDLKASSFRYGKLFETFLLQEMVRLNDYCEADFRFHYWRTNTGLEVDVVLTRGAASAPVAVEIKSKATPTEADLRSLHAFAEENRTATLLCLCTTPNPYRLGPIEILPWQTGLERIFPK